MNSLEHRLGKVVLEPSGPVIAGTVGQWALTLTVGSYGIDEGGTIKISRRFASDWQQPQLDHPTELGYTTATTSGDAKLALRWDPKGHIRPWMKCLVIDVYDGSLLPGDTLTVLFGDQSQGSPGIRAQTFQESAHEMRVLVDPTNACLVRPLPSSPVFPIVADQPIELVVILPTQAVVGQSVEISVKARDRWGNPTPLPGVIALAWEGDPVARINQYELMCLAPGSGRLTASWNGQTFSSNPLTVYSEEPKYKRYWGDLHAQTSATVGTGTEREYFTFGRDQARLDFTSHQGNDFQMTDEDWQRLNEVVREFHQDGRFVVFPGYEWSANTPAGGDRNVFYLEEGLPILRSSHWQTPEIAEDELTPAHPADVLFERLRNHVDINKVLLASHVGGRYADIRKFFDDQLGPLVELVSCWGVFEWMLWDAFEKGYKVGVMCNSDGHKGRPGAEGPGAGEFGLSSGLTCVLAETLTRRSVFEALKLRRCYGTSGPRMDLTLTVNGQPMGSELQSCDSLDVVASIRGTAPLDSLLLFQGRQIIETQRPTAFANCHRSRRVRVVWGGAKIRGRGRRAVWDGTVHVEGARITSVSPLAFDSPADGIVESDDHVIRFQSRTTGDLDGLDLMLDQAHAGTVTFKSPIGDLQADLATLDVDGCSKDYGGLDLRASIFRYPEKLSEMSLSLQREVTLGAGQTVPLFVKAIQVDGHMAWSSPVYVH